MQKQILEGIPYAPNYNTDTSIDNLFQNMNYLRSEISIIDAELNQVKNLTKSLITIAGITSVLATIATATLIAAGCSASIATTLSMLNPLLVAVIAIGSSIILGSFLGNALYNFFTKNGVAELKTKFHLITKVD